MSAKGSLTYKCRLPKDWRPVLEGGEGFNLEEDVNRWSQMWEDGSSMLAHTNPTLLDSLCIWVGLSLFTLESGGQAAYMETHP